jgi:hypothetical protein
MLNQRIEITMKMISYYQKCHRAAVEHEDMYRIEIYEKLIIATERRLVVLELLARREKVNSRPTNDGG